MRATLLVGGKMSKLSSIGGGGGSLPPLVINVAADFPTIIEANRDIGRHYYAGADVTDNDPTKTNTSQSFSAGEDFMWDGVSAYFVVGSNLTEHTFSFTGSGGVLPSTPPAPALVKCFRNGNKTLYGIDFTVTGNVLTWIGVALGGAEVIDGYYNDTALTTRRAIITKTASATLTGAEVAALIRGDSASDTIYTIPQTSTEGIAEGDWWDVYNVNSGDITLAKEGSDVLNGNTLVAPGAWARIVKSIEGAPNTYDILGGTDIQVFNLEHIIPGAIADSGGTPYRFSRPTFDGTIIDIIGKLRSGTADLDLEISGTPVTHTTLGLSSTESSQPATAANVFDNSDNIEYVITNAAAADRLELTLKCIGRL